MTPARLQTLIAITGWGQHELARRTGRHRCTIQHWRNGRTPVPADVATWLEGVAAYLAAHPAPRTKTPPQGCRGG